MLKSLGATMAQVTQRLRHGDASLAPGPYDRAQHVARRAARRRQMKTIALLAIVFVVMVGVFSFIFHELMAREGRTFSWPSSIYWTLTTMTTLGFGDITFESDAGRIFSVIVLLSGSTFLLVMLPFVFIQFVFIPWMNERERRRAPRLLPASTAGHVIVTSLGPVEEALIDRADQANVPYVVIVEDVDDAGRLHDEGRTVMVGALDDPNTYHSARVEQAATVVATRNDQTNTNIAFTVREIAPEVDIVASANSPASVDILEIAGADHVVQLGEILGEAMAARTLGLGGHCHRIGSFAGLQIAEVGAIGTDLVDHTLAESRLRARFGVGIIGVWERGKFHVATADTRLRDSSMLLLAGTNEQLEAFDRAFTTDSPTGKNAVIIGGGRVGRAVGRAFAAEDIEFAIIEQLPERQREGARYVIGDAADRHVLEEAGIAGAGAVLITTHDDNVNVYLTRYCRGLRPDVRIVSRSRLDRNVSTLYRAGADAVLSYAGTGSAAIWNHFRGEETLLVAHGLNLFRTPIPRELAGTSLADSHVYRRTQCNVVAVETDGEIRGNPDAHAPLPADGELVLVGTDEAETRFSEVFPHARHRSMFDRVRR
ncbi:MAG: NAD-binding protein [Ilumatobacter sp.]|uniref:potassium channel family protein n=1 Tax=Ilumatobacter sp. TaxID=1967498 RepID=UPI0026383414|nr:NAD-binding protein [Ilumatobacter sp.]MDJ0770113.1 NAD-binding protein [Ilumatobacter sp.]